jgi:hypothetical protein
MSADGAAWHLLSGSLTRVPLPSPALVGIAQNSAISGTLGPASYMYLAVGGISVSPTLPHSKHPCPDGWGCQDVGNTSPTGDQTYVHGAISIFGAGSNINGSIDRFHFVWHDMPGNGGLSAYLSAQQNTTSATKDGLMIRVSTGADAPYYGFFVTPANDMFVRHRIRCPAQHMRHRTTSRRKGERCRSGGNSSGGIWSPVPGTVTDMPLRSCVIKVDMSRRKRLTFLCWTTDSSGIPHGFVASIASRAGRRRIFVLDQNRL